MTNPRYTGFNPPFVGGPQKIMSRQDDDKLIRNDVLQNLLILPGELPFRPNFGVNLRNFVYEKLTDNHLQQLEFEIRQQVLINDPRLNIVSLTLIPNHDEAGLEITLVVSLIEDPDKNIEIKRLIKILSGNNNGN